MDDYYDHHKTAILLMKTGGLLSMLASHFIMRDVFIRFKRGERIKLTHKIVCELSLANFWGSFFAPFLSTWMVPKESGDYQAAGNTASCTAQGFFDSFFYGWSVLMNTILSITYCFIVKRGRRDEARSARSLWLIMGVPPIFCFILACKPLFDQAYNHSDFLVCSIAEHPLGCLSESYDGECARGSNAKELKIVRFSFVCLAFFIIVTSVGVLIRHVMAVERRMNLNSAEASNDLSTKVTWHGIFYVLSFAISWGPFYIWQWVRVTEDMKTMSSMESPALVYIISITYPFQGVGNAIVFFRPRYLKFRERDSEELRVASALRAMSVAVPPILTAEWWQSWRRKSDLDASQGSCSKDDDVEATAIEAATNSTAKCNNAYVDSSVCAMPEQSAGLKDAQ